MAPFCGRPCTPDLMLATRSIGLCQGRVFPDSTTYREPVENIFHGVEVVLREPQYVFDSMAGIPTAFHHHEHHEALR